MGKKARELEQAETGIVDLSKYGVLAEALSEPELDVNGLYTAAKTLLDQAGQETTINGLKAVATPQSMIVKDGDQTLFGRLAYNKKSNGGVPPPSIIFSKTPDFENITTANGYFSALEFNEAGMYDVHLVAGTGLTAAVDRPEYIELTRTIIESLTQQFSEASKAESKAIAQMQAQRQRKRMHRVGSIASTAAILAVFYGPQALDPDHIDAKIGSIPMPAPVEWVVDWNNHVDHVAQGFPDPKGALPLVLDKQVEAGAVPVLPDYDTDGVPDASFSTWLTMDDSNNSFTYMRDQSKPGLYKSDFALSHGIADSANFKGSPACYDILGDFRAGRTSIFTQTPGLATMVTLRLVDAHHLSVCKLPENGKVTPVTDYGSIYLYQKH